MGGSGGSGAGRPVGGAGPVAGARPVGAGAEPAAGALPPTPSQTIGPFYGYALPYPGGGQLAPAHREDAVTLHGQVLDGAGQPVPDALLEFWQADPAGSLAGAPGSLRRDGHAFTGFARVATDPDGHWVLRTLVPAVPDGSGARQDPAPDPAPAPAQDPAPVSVQPRPGEVQPGGQGQAYRRPATPVRSAPYLSVVVFARGLMHHLHTRIYLPQHQAAFATDPLLRSLDEARRRTLIASEEADGALRFDVRLQGGEETVFLDFRDSP